MEFIPKEIEDYCRTHSTSEHETYQRLADDTYADEELPQMFSGPLVGNFLQLMVRLTKARRVLDVGTFTGYSALKMAEVLPQDGEVWTFDIKLTALAKKYISEVSWGGRIRFMKGLALKGLESVDPPVDLIFIDADKDNYLNYYRRGMDLLRHGGIIVLDNTLWSGRVLNPEDTSDRAIVEVNDYIQKDDRVFNQLLPIRDGLMVAYKLG